MRPRMLLALAAAALVLAAASSAYQRAGPRRMVTGEAWCRTPAPCVVPVLGAGFPLPFLIDNPQISVPNAIGLVEDNFRPGAFLLDALFFFALAVLVLSRIQRSKETDPFTRVSASVRSGRSHGEG